MATNISQLEQDWLAAEAMADEIKAQARQLRGSGEIEVSIGEVEELNAKQNEAERAASEAFDRLWSAREQQVA
ncbi:MAG: hypothetical protein AAF346_03410 [Pseudomonadota bacterium]